MMKVIQNFTVIAVVLFGLSGCLKDDVKLDFEELTKIDRAINFEGPLVNAEFSADQLISRMGDSISDFLFIADDGFMSIKYKDSMHTSWNGIVDIKGINESVSIPISKKTQVETQIIEQRVNFNSSAEQRFDSLIVASSSMNLTIDFPDNFAGPVTVEFPELTKNGQSLLFEFDAAEGNSSASENLEGYRIIFKHGADSSYITMVMTADMTPTGTPDPTQQMTMTMQMTDLTPTVMFGYFGQSRILDKEQTLSFGFFEDFKVINLVEFFDIQLLVEFNNYFGIPYNGTIADAVVFRRSTNESVELDLNNNTAFVPGAGYNEEVEPTFNSFLYTKNNSNIGDVVNMFPDKIDYRLQIDINPNGEADDNFVTEKNSIEGNIYLSIPLWLRTEEYFRYDTIHNFNMIAERDSNQLSGIESAEFYFTLHNGFPFEIDAQVFVADNNNVVVDSLFNAEQHLLETGILGDDDKVIERSNTQVEINISRDQLLDYKALNVSKIILRTKTATAYKGERFVKLYDHYGVGFELNAKLVSGEYDF